MQANSGVGVYIETICLQLSYSPPLLEVRTLVDNWFAYRAAGPFLKRSLRPEWFNRPDPTKAADALKQMHFISDKAAATFGRLSKYETHLVKDHAVPVIIITQKLKALAEPIFESVESVLTENYRLGVITKKEDILLNKAGFKSDMPDGQAGVFSRYHEAGIAGVVNEEAIAHLCRLTG